MDSVEREEMFLRKLEQLSNLTPKQKKSKLARMKENEERLVDEHRRMNCFIAEERAFANEAVNDENYNHDQPL